MRIDNNTIGEMFAVLRNKIISTGSPPKIIRFFDAADNILCEIPFHDIVEDTFAPGNFYFQDPYGNRVIRNIIIQTGTVANFKIYDSSFNFVILGTVSVFNGGGDIVFNTIEWEKDQVAIISSLKINFYSE